MRERIEQAQKAGNAQEVQLIEQKMQREMGLWSFFKQMFSIFAGVCPVATSINPHIRTNFVDIVP